MIQYILPDANEVPSNTASNPVALQGRQYEGCVTVVPAATWLPPSYTSCVVQETPIPCYAPYPPPTCPAVTPTPQPHLSKPNSDSSQSQSGSQSNTSSDASVNVSGDGGGGNGSQSTAIIVGVTIGAVVLLILIVALAVWGARRRHRRTPRLERGNVLGPDYLTAGVLANVRAHGHRDQRSTGVGGGGGNGGGEAAPGKNGMGEGKDTGGKVSAGVGRDASKGSKKRAERHVSRGTPASVSGPQPPAEVRKADVRPPEPSDQRHSRQSSKTRSSRSGYRPENHGEHPINDIFYSPGTRRERIQRRKQRQEENGPSADDHMSPLRAERENRTPNDIPLPSSPMRDVATRMGATGELDRANGDVQSPSTGRWRLGKPYFPYSHRMGDEDESNA